MIAPPNCHKRKCVYYKGIKWLEDEEDSEVPYCAAYSDGIPDDIAYGSDKHLEVRDDQDNEIVYEEFEEQ